MEETIYEISSNLSNNQEETLLVLSNALNNIAVNNPEIDFEVISLQITNILRLMDETNINLKNKEVELQTLKSDMKVLEARFSLEKEIRQEELDNSLKIYDQSELETSSLNERISALQAALRQRDLNFASISAEKDSIKVKLDDMYNNFTALKCENENKGKTIGSLSVKLNVANKEISQLSKMSKDKWVDDDIIDDYFKSMQNIANDKGHCLFISPAISHSIKLSDEVTLDLVNTPSYQACKYVFIAVNNSTGGSGSHWSLLFIDKFRQHAYHLDSISGLNTRPALKTASRLNVSEENVFQVNCFQQNNGYECGINVIVHAKLIFNYFCCSEVKTHFLDWFKSGPSFDHKLNGTDNSIVVADCNSILSKESSCKEVENFCNANCHKVTPITVKKSSSENWKLVKKKHGCSKKIKMDDFVNHSLDIKCKNRFEGLSQPETGDVCSVRNSSGLWKQKNLKSRSECDKSLVSKSKSKCMSKRESNTLTVTKGGKSKSNKPLKNQIFIEANACTSVQSDSDVERSVNKYRSINSFDDDVLLIGDSILRFASEAIAKRGATVELCPGAKIKDIKGKLLNYTNAKFSVIYIHVGTNNLKRGYKGSAGYNGGHGKREALNEMADLLFTVKTYFPNAMVFVNSVIIRSDLSYKALFDYNEQLDSMCNNFGVFFVEANCWVNRSHLANDGRHLNHRGSYQLGKLFSEVFSATSISGGAYDGLDVSSEVAGHIIVEADIARPAPPEPVDVLQETNNRFLDGIAPK